MFEVSSGINPIVIIVISWKDWATLLLSLLRYSEYTHDSAVYIVCTYTKGFIYKYSVWNLNCR